jgi:hypothetical protein
MREEECRLRLFENRVQGRISGPRRGGNVGVEKTTL